jgi:uncharacterized LabA/DUF88 family protein
VTDEIALFIDFENIRYSLINVQRREPDPQELIALARRFGTIMVARAYADWARQPEFFKGSLTAAMIDRVDCPSKVRERFRQTPQFQHQGPYVPGLSSSGDELPDEERYGESGETGLATTEEQSTLDRENDVEAAEASDEEAEAPSRSDDGESFGERRPRVESGYGGYAGYNSGGNYGNGGYGGHGNGGNYANGGYPAPTPVITQSTVDLNMLMDMIETVFDRPNISTFILMSGDRDFTRICARLKLRLNKRVIVVGVPGTVSRDLISAAEQFIPLGVTMPQIQAGGYYPSQQQMAYAPPQGPVEPEEPGFIQFLDYIDRHWSWRTVGGVANFIGDPYNPKNRFRGRLTRDSARDLLRICIDEGILVVGTDVTGSENLRLNRSHPAVESVLSESALH